MTSFQNKGMYWALVSAGISGMSIFINKFAVDAIKQPLAFTSIKNSGVALLIVSVLVMTGKWRQIRKINIKDKLSLMAIGIIGGSIPFVLFFTGLAMTPAVNGAIIQKTLVIWVVILAIPFLKERITLKKAGIVALLFAANSLVGGFKGFQFSAGELMIFVATIFWAVETVIAKKMLVRIDPLILTAARMGIGAVILLTITAVWQPTSLVQISTLSVKQWFWLVLTMVSLLGYVTTWYKALKLAPAITVTSILVGSTLITNILSAIFITHSYNSLTIIQTLIIITCIKLLVANKTKFAGSSIPDVQIPRV